MDSSAQMFSRIICRHSQLAGNYECVQRSWLATLKLYFAVAKRCLSCYKDWCAGHQLMYPQLVRCEVIIEPQVLLAVDRLQLQPNTIVVGIATFYYFMQPIDLYWMDIAASTPSRLAKQRPSNGMSTTRCSSTCLCVRSALWNARTGNLCAKSSGDKKLIITQCDESSWADLGANPSLRMCCDADA